MTTEGRLILEPPAVVPAGATTAAPTVAPATVPTGAPRLTTPGSAPHPRYAVWELTLKCDLACRHCGSRAGRPRADELSLDAALDVVRQLAEMGTAEIAFIGGEAYLYPDWLAVVRAAADAGIRCTMPTGARALDAGMARAAADAGMVAVSVSVDGLAQTHDTLRAVVGSHAAALRALGNIKLAGMDPLANTQISQPNLPELEALADLLTDHGVATWQVQLTGPMGRAADRPEWLLQPYQMLDLVPRLAAIAERLKRAGCRIHAANNLGYFGPHESALRAAYWQGCQAGRFVLGIEADGAIKGCPSLPTAPYSGGNIRERPLREIWTDTAALRFIRDRRRDELWGFCQTCYYAELCGAGCSWTAHTLLGRRGNMPYCHHRALELKQRGIRERIVQVASAPGEPFDFGRFELVEEPLPESLPA